MNRSDDNLVSTELCHNCGAEVLPAMLRCRECGTPKERYIKKTEPSDHNLVDKDKQPVRSESSKPEHQQNRSSDSQTPSEQDLPKPATKTPDRIRTKCKKCQQVVKAPISLAGQSIPCPKCGSKVALPRLKKSKKENEETIVDPGGKAQTALMNAIQTALAQGVETNLESRTKNDQSRRSQVKKLVATIEKCTGEGTSYESTKAARQAIQELMKLQSVSGGEAILELYPKLPEKVRPVAIQSLGELQVNGAFETLLITLMSSTQDEFEAAIRALGDYRNIAAVRPLLIVPSLHPDQRIRASVAIAKLGEEALPALLETLENATSEEIRFATMESLKSLKSPKSVDALISIIQRDRTVLRRMAVEALGEIDHPKKHRILMKLTNDSDPMIRELVLAAMAKKPHPSSLPSFVAALDDESNDVKKSSLTAIGELGEAVDKSVMARIVKFLDQGSDEELKFHAVQTISKLGDKRITPQVLKLLQEELNNEAEDLERLGSLVRCLRRLKDPRAVLPVCDLIESTEDSKLKRRAVEALGAIGDSAAKTVLEHALIQDEASEVRAAAAQALGTLGETSAAASLIKALHDSQNVRIKALIALGQLKSSRVGPMIKEMLNDPSPTIRYQAISILSEMGDPQYISNLEILAGDDDEMVQRAALKALQSLGDDRSEKEILKVASKAKRSRSARKLQDQTVPDAIVGLFSGIPGGLATGCVAALVLVVGVISLFFFRSDATASSKVVVRGYVQAISVDEAGKFVFVNRTRGLTEIWNLANNERVWHGEEIPTASGVVYSSRSETALVTKSKLVHFVKIGSNGEFSDIEEKTIHDATITTLVPSMNHQYAVTLDTDMTMHLWDIQKQKSISNKTLPTGTVALAVDNYGAQFASGANRGVVKIWSPDANEPTFDNTEKMKELSITGETTSIAFSLDGKILAHCTSAGKLLVTEIETGKLLSHTELMPGKTSLYFNESGELIVVGPDILKMTDLSQGVLDKVGVSIRARTTESFCATENILLMGSDEEKPVTIMKISTGKTEQLDTE